MSDEWTLTRVEAGRRGNITINSPVLVRAPGCPEGRHPTRDCGCKVFKRTVDAERYIVEQQALASS